MAIQILLRDVDPRPKKKPSRSCTTFHDFARRASHRNWRILAKNHGEASADGGKRGYYEGYAYHTTPMSNVMLNPTWLTVAWGSSDQSRTGGTSCTLDSRHFGKEARIRV